MDKHEHRRRRLLELRDWECEGKIARMAERIARSDSYVARMLYEEGKPGKKRIGDDMLDILEDAFSLDHGWFDLPFGTPVRALPKASLGVAERHAAVPVSLTARRPTFHWPFPTVTYQRVMELRQSLGAKRGAEALRDIDALLDIAVAKWERLGKTTKRTS